MNLNETQATLLIKSALDHNAAIIATAALWLGKIKDQKDVENVRRSLEKIDEQYSKNIIEILTEYQEPTPTVPERPAPNPPSTIPNS